MLFLVSISQSASCFSLSTSSQSVLLIHLILTTSHPHICHLHTFTHTLNTSFPPACLLHCFCWHHARCHIKSYGLNLQQGLSLKLHDSDLLKQPSQHYFIWQGCSTVKAYQLIIWIVFLCTAVSGILYALPAWRILLNSSQCGRIDAFLSVHTNMAFFHETFHCWCPSK